MKITKRIQLKNLLNKKGNSEIIGFAVVIPLVITILIFFVYMSQVVIAKQKCEYAVYTGARAIVVSDYSGFTNPLEAAKINADAIAGESLPYEFKSFINIEGANKKWVKGSIITYTIIFETPTIYGGEQTVSASIAMMIENPVNINS